ncbi:MAG TPA: TIGR04211 family SH3 domain-containing protein [Steroidobacteraceae bacterium]|jgi:hypothetical protein|nr:TIGR04211 family SH3 domain-containing protein [Steroidobacteraceae bacterium]
MKILARTCCLSVATLSLLAAVALPAAAQDETVPDEPLRRLFVSDKLVLNVYSEPEQAGSRVATIETGDAVDEIERGQGFVRIRLTDGREGWVGSNYLTSDAPAVVQLRDLQRQQKAAAPVVDKKATEEIARLKKESESLQAQVKELKTAAAAAPVPADEGVLEGASPAPQRLAAVAPPSNSGPIWMWALIVVAAAGLAYFAGYQSLARRIHKKFGGLRIY